MHSGVSAYIITINYLEPGHIFNAADSFHRIIEQEFIKSVYHFDDLTSVVNFKSIAIAMPSNDFKLYCKG